MGIKDHIGKCHRVSFSTRAEVTMLKLTEHNATERLQDRANPGGVARHMGGGGGRVQSHC